MCIRDSVRAQSAGGYFQRPFGNGGSRFSLRLGRKNTIFPANRFYDSAGAFDFRYLAAMAHDLSRGLGNVEPIFADNRIGVFTKRMADQSENGNDMCSRSRNVVDVRYGFFDDFFGNRIDSRTIF